MEHLYIATVYGAKNTSYPTTLRYGIELVLKQRQVSNVKALNIPQNIKMISVTLPIMYFHSITGPKILCQNRNGEDNFVPDGPALTG